jgi:Flp pilus assembly protein TadG
MTMRSWTERSARWLPGRRAQALIEFCLVLPLLLVVLSIAVDLARYFHYQLVLEDIVTDAARYATVKDPSTGQFPSDSQVDSRIQTAFPPNLGSYTVSKNLNATVGTDAAVSIRISCQVKAFSLILDHLISNPFTIEAQAWQPKR